MCRRKRWIRLGKHVAHACGPVITVYNGEDGVYSQLAPMVALFDPATRESVKVSGFDAIYELRGLIDTVVNGIATRRMHKQALAELRGLCAECAELAKHPNAVAGDAPFCRDCRYATALRVEEAFEKALESQA